MASVDNVLFDRLFFERLCDLRYALKQAMPKEQSLDDFIAQKAERDTMRTIGKIGQCDAIADGDHDEAQPASAKLVKDTLRKATKACKWPVLVTEGHKAGMPWTDYVAVAQTPRKADNRMIFGIGFAGYETMERLTQCADHAEESTQAMNGEACHECDGKGQVRGEIFLAEDTCKGCNGSGLRT